MVDVSEADAVIDGSSVISSGSWVDTDDHDNNKVPPANKPGHTAWFDYRTIWSASAEIQV